MDRFREALEDAGLHDLGFTGDVFTWRNQQHRGDDYIRERLDRAVANVEWRIHFPLVHVLNGDPYHSDHRPVIVSTEKKKEERAVGKKPFHFEANWLEESQCRKVVEEAWEGAQLGVGSGVYEALKEVSGSLYEWSVNVLGDLEKRLKKAKKELELCRKSAICDTVVGREVVLRFKVDRLEEQVDIY